MGQGSKKFFTLKSSRVTQTVIFGLTSDGNLDCQTGSTYSLNAFSIMSCYCKSLVLILRTFVLPIRYGRQKEFWPTKSRNEVTVISFWITFVAFTLGVSWSGMRLFSTNNVIKAEAHHNVFSYIISLPACHNQLHVYCSLMCSWLGSDFQRLLTWLYRSSTRTTQCNSYCNIPPSWSWWKLPGAHPTAASKQPGAQSSNLWTSTNFGFSSHLI